MIYKFVCPTHKEVVLYTETEEQRNSIGFVTVENPEVCTKCQKPYYKWECTEVKE